MEVPKTEVPKTEVPKTEVIKIIRPFLIGRYERLKSDIEDFFKNIYVSDLDEDVVDDVFFDYLIASAKNENKLLTKLFVKNNFDQIYNLIISHTDKDQNNP